MKFDTMLRRLMPNVDKKADRLRRFRHFVADTMMPRNVQGQVDQNGHPKLLSEQERLVLAGEFIEKCKAGVSDECVYAVIAPRFEEWWPQHLTMVRSKAAGGKGAQPKGKERERKPSFSNESAMHQSEMIDKLRDLVVSQSREVVELRAEVKRLRAEHTISKPKERDGTQAQEEVTGKEAKGTTGIRKKSARLAKISLDSLK